jgi:hypothetical protein
MRNKKSQRRSRKACRSRRAGRKAYRSRKARRSMYGGVVVTVHNQNPPSYKDGSYMKIQHKSPDVLSEFIDSLNDDGGRVGVADVFAKGRGTTRGQLINDLRSGKLLLHLLDYSKYAIISDTDPRPSFPEPFRMPEYFPPPPPGQTYVSPDEPMGS